MHISINSSRPSSRQTTLELSQHSRMLIFTANVVHNRQTTLSNPTTILAMAALSSQIKDYSILPSLSLAKQTRESLY